MAKVVYNSEFGGFALSKLAAMWLAGRGHEKAIQWLSQEKNSGTDMGENFYADGVLRHDPLLVECVEVLGADVAGGEYSVLKIKEVEDLYMIEEYDGAESVVEPWNIQWYSASHPSGTVGLKDYIENKLDSSGKERGS